ncbi:MULTISPECIES: hypothetical protein [Mesorhizobium]|uniref:hypothetical protein n=1 Tax=Mesorhizobium TaxID=68287 RepID=UPI00315D3124
MICERIADGESLRSICDCDDMPIVKLPIPSPHVASMSHGLADSRRKPLEINGSGLQHGAT